MTLLISSIGFSLHAQEKQREPRKPPSIEERTERAKKDLGLSEKQTEQWVAIHEKYEKSMKANRENREQNRKVIDKLDAELSTILDDGQREKFAEQKKKRPKGRKPGG